MRDARWETVLKSVRNQSRENAIIQVAVNKIVKDGCTLYTQSLIKAQIYQEDHKSSP